MPGSMNDPTPTAWVHHSYGFHPGLGHHAYGGGSWIAHMVVSSIIHGLIYGAIFRVMRHLSLGEILLIAAIVIGLFYGWNRNRGYRRW